MTLQNRLLDHQDKDNLYRLNSAEADGYRKGACPADQPPAGDADGIAARDGMGGGAVLHAARRDQRHLSVDNVAVVNVNTAPERLLRTIDGVDEDMARRAIAYRKVQPFLTETAFFRVPRPAQVGRSAGRRVSCDVGHFEAMAFVRGASGRGALDVDPDRGSWSPLA